MLKRVAAVAVLVIIAGCATPDKMNRLAIGMTKEQVIAKMGQPESTAAQGQIEVLRYVLAKDQVYHTDAKLYYVRMISGHVESYGQMGDFDSTKEAAMNLNINSK